MAAQAPSPRQKTPQRRAARRWLTWFGVVVLAAWLLPWTWRQPFMAKPRTLWELSRMPSPAALPVPVAGVAARQIADTFGAPRGTDRTHAGVDILAPRGTPVFSTTRGIVVAVREGGLGGKQVWVLGPGRERHYYAHLDDWAPDLQTGDLVRPGDPLGVIGATGNARGTPPHLHYGIYGPNGAYDPLPLMRNFSSPRIR